MSYLNLIRPEETSTQPPSLASLGQGVSHITEHDFRAAIRNWNMYKRNEESIYVFKRNEDEFSKLLDIPNCRYLQWSEPKCQIKGPAKAIHILKLLAGPYHYAVLKAMDVIKDETV